MARELIPVCSEVVAAARAARLGHGGAVVWLTGLSGAGKSTIAYALERTLFARGALAYVVDGDNLRGGLCADLGFAPADRAENVRRAAEVAALLVDAGLIAIMSLISPLRAMRTAARARIGAAFLEVYLDVPVAVCERRDPKALYAHARAGKVAGLTGVAPGAAYEPPEAPELALDTDALDVAACVARIEAALADRGVLAPAGERA